MSLLQIRKFLEDVCCQGNEYAKANAQEILKEISGCSGTKDLCDLIDF